MVITALVLLLGGWSCHRSQGDAMENNHSSREETAMSPVIIALPTPDRTGVMPFETALQRRRSLRVYGPEALTLAEAAQLLWAAQGRNASRHGFRTAPSAGALYPLEVYLLCGRVTDISAGIYRYRPQSHDLEQVKSGDYRSALSEAGLSQSPLREAPAVLVFTAIPERTTIKYGQRGLQYIYMEAGHAAQNVCLQAEALSLGTVPIGAFEDQAVGRVLNIGAAELPLYLLPVGRRASAR